MAFEYFVLKDFAVFHRLSGAKIATHACLTGFCGAAVLIPAFLSGLGAEEAYLFKVTFISAMAGGFATHGWVGHDGRDGVTKGILAACFATYIGTVSVMLLIGAPLSFVLGPYALLWLFYEQPVCFAVWALGMWGIHHLMRHWREELRIKANAHYSKPKL